jgi:hypothetical protein
MLYDEEITFEGELRSFVQVRDFSTIELCSLAYGA